MLSGFVSAGGFKGDGARSQTPFGVEGPGKEWEGPQAPREATGGCRIQALNSGSAGGESGTTALVGASPTL